MTNSGDPGAVATKQRAGTLIDSRRFHPLAISALMLAVLGTIGFFVLDMRAILLSVAAIILGIIALRRMRAKGERGRWLAISGIIVGAITPIALALLLFGLFAASVANT